MNLLPCRLCGGVIADVTTHLMWHLRLDGLDPLTLQECPVDGAPIAYSSSQGDGSGSTTWACGHGAMWLAPEPADD